LRKALQFYSPDALGWVMLHRWLVERPTENCLSGDIAECWSQLLWCPRQAVRRTAQDDEQDSQGRSPTGDKGDHAQLLHSCHESKIHAYPLRHPPWTHLHDPSPLGHCARRSCVALKISKKLTGQADLRHQSQEKSLTPVTTQDNGSPTHLDNSSGCWQTQLREEVSCGYSFSTATQ
jgi:hypothetical protein